MAIQPDELVRAALFCSEALLPGSFIIWSLLKALILGICCSARLKQSLWMPVGIIQTLDVRVSFKHHADVNTLVQLLSTGLQDYTIFE